MVSEDMSAGKVVGIVLEISLNLKCLDDKMMF